MSLSIYNNNLDLSYLSFVRCFMKVLIDSLLGNFFVHQY